MAYPFPSQAWADAFRTEIEQSTAYATAARLWEGDVILAIEEGGGLYLDLWHGACREATYLADLGDRRAEFTLLGSMANWRKVLDQQLDPIQAMMNRQLRLQGNLAKVMRHLTAAQALVQCAIRVPIAKPTA